MLWLGLRVGTIDRSDPVGHAVLELGERYDPGVAHAQLLDCGRSMKLQVAIRRMRRPHAVAHCYAPQGSGECQLSGTASQQGRVT